MSLTTFFTELSGPQMEALFAQPYAAVALFRSLPPPARHVLLRFAWTSGEVSTALVSSWARPEAEGKLSGALRQLTALRLLSQAAHSGGAVYVLHPSFQAQLRHVLCSGLSAELVAPAAAVLPSAPPAPPADDLSEYARQQWEALLLHVVDGSSPPPALPPGLQAEAGRGVDVPALLAGAGLVVKCEGAFTHTITESGFRFLLADVYTQLWGVVRQYLAALGGAPGSSAGPDLAVALNFLLRLGLQAGRPMPLAQLGGAERTIAAHMAQLGLLLPASAPGGALWLHPTHLAAVLAGGGRSGEAAAGGEEGYVIVESNYRVYAYTTSPVQISILRLFVRVDALLPNLVVGTITRESATAALGAGIAADQVVSFLRQHAHPRAAAKPPIVPAVVADQLRLWQQELTRLGAQAATLYSRFESPELYERAVAHARQLGALLTSNPDRQLLVVPAGFHDAMRAYLRDRKQQLGLG
ncbi:general transcription factor IIH subunit 4 isoform A [Micractinium conductrix]|uniref:RNA polymerase II transcription factor B subunit 2 n=1 Tax=Micractinium conductrix TaxID=554055 RepID=A0A2P6V697_9CHLO|nr:general transcription factor IIH subunit 4 isoform A [Micractinium conductrix]|eukprot:PSC69613.1 general transcription factor IIH subunit 4 isoform A [Micractinium conductrix]